MTRRLLLIDDHALFRSGIAMVLNAGLGDVEIFEAASIESALQCPCELPELVLLDVQLDGLNGLDGIIVLKRKWPSANVVMVSAIQDSHVVSAALDLGAQGFICKTDPPARMLEMISQVLAGQAPLTPSNVRIDSISQRAPLTPRQCEVLDFVCQGLSNKMIGRRLELSENTVRGHVQAILAALQVASRSEAAFVARRKGLIH